jgi:UDP-glucose:(heptosyl)LPS alpha-1,3-glucosyltransferase
MRLAELGLADRVTLHGRVGYGETGRFYAAADVVICPTLADYRSLNGFEAVNAGKPVLISRYDGAHEEIAAVAPAARVIDPRDHDALVAALAAVLEPGALADLKRAAARVPPDFTLERVGDNLARAITMALER